MPECYFFSTAVKCNSFDFTLVTENDINIIISKLNSKMSSGKDGISNIVLKAIMPVI